MKKDDEGVRAVREARQKISAAFDHDPDKVVAHYMKMQEQFRDRLLEPVVVEHNDGETT